MAPVSHPLNDELTAVVTHATCPNALFPVLSGLSSSQRPSCFDALDPDSLVHAVFAFLKKLTRRGIHLDGSCEKTKGRTSHRRLAFEWKWDELTRLTNCRWLEEEKRKLALENKLYNPQQWDRRKCGRARPRGIVILYISISLLLQRSNFPIYSPSRTNFDFPLLHTHPQL
jgi:hypothetical protein